MEQQNTCTFDVSAMCAEAPEFESAAAFAARVGMSTRHIDRMAAQGRIPALRLGRAVRIPVRPALEAMAQAAAHASKEQA